MYHNNKLFANAANLWQVIVDFIWHVSFWMHRHTLCEPQSENQWTLTVLSRRLAGQRFLSSRQRWALVVRWCLHTA